jgi:hypothetical protein
MAGISTAALMAFLEQLGLRYQSPARLYLLRGGPLLLLGSPRETFDVDYLFVLDEEGHQSFRQILDTLSNDLKLDLEWVPLDEFIPLPPGAEDRKRFLGRFGQVDVYIFDLYSIALSKIARGFEPDLEDVLYLLEQGLIEFGELEKYFKSILPVVQQADIVPSEFEAYFETLRSQWEDRLPHD